MTDWVTLRPGAYHDSVSLMRASNVLADLDGVEAATMAMATELNRDLLARNGFAVPEHAGPNDLVIAIRATDDAALERARTQVETVQQDLRGRADRGPRSDVAPPRTVGSAARRLDASAGGNSVALISVPGPYAYVEALDALEAGLDVVVFSDNVPVAQEVALKEEGRRRGLLVMGPDCGTVVVGGVGLGFANALRPGHVGLVAASGTGAQQIACLLDAAGTGVSHVLGVGGRDLSSEVAGRGTVHALTALDADPATELIVVISKPPDPEVDLAVRRAAAALPTPTLVASLGQGRDDLTAVAEKAVSATGGRPARWPHWPAPTPQRPRPGAVRGLFAGGTLCEEAMLLAAEALGPVRSNIPLHPDLGLDSDLRGPGHVMLDFGDDDLTRGRPHPMIDSSLRLERLAAESRDPDCAVVLLDVLLGYAADPDPAATLVPAIRDGRAAAERDGRDLAVVVSLCGTSADPQGLDRQAEEIRDAGAAVFLSNAAAAHHAVGLIERAHG